MHEEVRHLAGDSLFVLPTEQWLPRKRALQPVFTKRNVRSFGGHMSKAAEALCESWPESGEVDLDADCRRLTMRSLGRSVLGLNLNEHADAIAEHIHVASSYTADRALRPVRAPWWLPTPVRTVPAPRLPRCAGSPTTSCRSAERIRLVTPRLCTR